MRRFRGFERAERLAIVVALMARDGPVCGICEGALDPAIVDPDHRAATTIDHVVPLSAGGDVGTPERLENLRLAHGFCNAHRVRNAHLKPHSFAAALRNALGGNRATP